MHAHPDTSAHTAGRAVAVLMFGNFVVASGVLVVPGMLDQLARDLGVSVPVAGQLLGLAALAMCLGAPVLAAITSHLDRRRLLVMSLWAVAAGHLACAMAPDYPVLALIRPFSVLGVAVLTPQAAATIGLMVPVTQRATAVTTLFLGWSLASVVAMPVGNLLAAYWSWRAGFGVVGVLAIVAALMVGRVVPSGLRGPPLSLRSWLSVATAARLRLIILSTCLWCAGYFMVLGYVTPAMRHFIAATPTTQAVLMTLMGVFGLAGNLVLSRVVRRIGPDRGARLALWLVVAGLALWSITCLLAPSPAGLALALMVWGAGSFAFVSAQQARLAASAPELASASIALNSASLYAGQALGAAGGGVLVAQLGYGALGPVALFLVLGAMVLCIRADRGTAP